MKRRTFIATVCATAASLAAFPVAALCGRREVLGARRDTVSAGGGFKHRNFIVIERETIAGTFVEPDGLPEFYAPNGTKVYRPFCSSAW